jgi:crossover junction endodeoxyribonuclease RuvC
MRILAIDPGYDRIGIAVIEGDASKPTLVWSDCILPLKGSPEKRLAYIFREVSRAVEKHKPEGLGIETLFFGINKKTALGVAEARGVILAIAGLSSLPVIECTPVQVKLAVAGHGGADKKAVALMVPRLLTLGKKKRLDDEIDAIAVGITALAMGFSLR